jgi:hypothetical protein
MYCPASDEGADRAACNADSIFWATAHKRAGHRTTPGSPCRRSRITQRIRDSVSVSDVDADCCCGSEWSGDPSKSSGHERGICDIRQSLITEMERVLTKKVVISRPP